MRRDELGFQWANYPAHRFLIALRFKQAQRLTRCSVCDKRPLVRYTVLVHELLRGVNAHQLNAKPLIVSLALCREHDGWADEQLADHVWPQNVLGRAQGSPRL